MNLWDAIGWQSPSILACSGAGGKTSVLMTLAACARLHCRTMLLTTTTKMYWNQVKDWHPVLADDFAEGAAAAERILQTEGLAGWFTGLQEQKVTGLPPQWIDTLAQRAAFSETYIAVEADGAKERLIKASADCEPVIPVTTAITLGVLSLEAVGLPLSSAIAHRLELVMEILGKEQGERIDERDLAKLALHERGIFRHGRGRQILLLTGGNSEKAARAEPVIDYLRSRCSNITKCIVTEGYGARMKPLKVVNV
ncbi:MAG: hypothetical protein H6Q65_487 [Firmicutes bacterium]|nr:hypothetical protein [Bacillota bacterium]